MSPQESRSFGRHARATAELPFKLSIESGIRLLRLHPTNAALPIVVRNTHSWVLGFDRTSETPGVLAKPCECGLTSGANHELAEISDRVVRTNLDRAVILPAGTILQLWLPLEPNPPTDFSEWATDPKTKKLCVFYLNEFLLRYQVASGFNDASAQVGPVSELELRQLFIQMYSDDTPSSNTYSLVSAPPGTTRESPSAPVDISARFDDALMAPAIPLWLSLAHDAHSLFRRGRHDQALVGWIQSLEVGIGQVARLVSDDLDKRATIEDRLAALVKHANVAPLDPDVTDKLRTARRLRNRVIHGGPGGPVQDDEAQVLADAIISALAMLEQIGLRLFVKPPNNSIMPHRH
jgi:hypothetical protein